MPFYDPAGSQAAGSAADPFNPNFPLSCSRGGGISRSSNLLPWCRGSTTATSTTSTSLLPWSRSLAPKANLSRRIWSHPPSPPSFALNLAGLVFICIEFHIRRIALLH